MDKEKIEEILKKDIFEELGLDDLDLGERLSLLEDMLQIVVQGVWLRILEILPLEKQKELAQLMDKYRESPEAVEYFLMKEIPNLEDILKEEVARYKYLLMSEVNKSQ